jgi:DNA ligase D-like protein (predicted 3'-phosphoesterase)
LKNHWWLGYFCHADRSRRPVVSQEWVQFKSGSNYETTLIKETMTKDKLEEYKKKRDFDKTSEPGDEDVSFDWAEGRPIFVIQKHDASTLHYDFRIEVDGVLKSWAVPKGPSTDPGVKRLAIPTEDHPLGYADFEGIIPEGEYGGGTMIVWDRGTYRNLKEADEEGRVPSVTDQIEKGHVTIWLEGEKLQGGYALIRIGGNGGKPRWLLIKMDDDEADARRNPTSTENKSVKTGRTLDEIGEEEQEDEEMEG